MGFNNPKKSLGQHWLTDESVLQAIVEAANLNPNDTVLEIGPGLGTLTNQLLKTVSSVTAVEFDHDLAISLMDRLGSPSNLKVIEQDILSFDLTSMPTNYVIVANIPYYLTSQLIRVISESSNPPKTAVILIQKEVAERVCAKPGSMSLLSVSAQVFFVANLDIIVPAELFTPPPKVDSQVLVLHRRQEPLVNVADQKVFFQVVKAGFSERRKKLRSSLSGGLRIEKSVADNLLDKSGISANARAQELSIEQWLALTNNYTKH